jgi:hypothetical protein
MLLTIAWGIALILFMIVGNTVRLLLVLERLRGADNKDIDLAWDRRASVGPPKPHPTLP